MWSGSDIKVLLLPLEEQNFGDIVTPENGCLKLCKKPKCVLLMTVTSERETGSIEDQENLEFLFVKKEGFSRKGNWLKNSDLCFQVMSRLKS